MAGIVTRLVVKYRGGYVSVDSAMIGTWGLREQFATVDVGTPEQATLVATTLLGFLDHERVRGTAEVTGQAAVAESRPWFGYQPGQYVNVPNEDQQAADWWLTQSISFAVADSGYIQWVTELGADPIDDANAVVQRLVRRLMMGTLATPSAVVPSKERIAEATKHQPQVVPVVFSFSGAITVSGSPRWYIRKDSKGTKVTVSLDTAGTSNTTVDVLLNGTTFVTVTLGSGVNQNTAQIQEAFTAGDYVTSAVTAVGTGTPSDLTIQVDCQDESAPPPA